MRILKLYFLLFLIANLAGCATAPNDHHPMMTWPERATVLSGIKNWNIDGVIAVRTSAGSAGNEGGSANLQWQQKNKNYTILIFGPLGADLTQLSGQPGHITLETANGKKITASSIEQLLTQQTGWQLPVSNLYYWIRGLPVPGQPAQKQFDPYFHLVKLNQQGWTVRFLRYTTTHQVDLPTKILLENWRMKIKINISQWQLISSH